MQFDVTHNLDMNIDFSLWNKKWMYIVIILLFSSSRYFKSPVLSISDDGGAAW